MGNLELYEKGLIEDPKALELIALFRKNRNYIHTYNHRLGTYVDNLSEFEKKFTSYVILLQKKLPPFFLAI